MPSMELLIKEGLVRLMRIDDYIYTTNTGFDVDSHINFVKKYKTLIDELLIYGLKPHITLNGILDEINKGKLT